MVVAPSRLLVVLEPTALLRVLDRLVVLDLLPDALRFEQQQSGAAVLQLEWEHIDPSKAMNVRDRLAQIPAVVTAEFGASGRPCEPLVGQ